jgi:hypothetical protein
MHRSKKGMLFDLMCSLYQILLPNARLRCSMYRSFFPLFCICLHHGKGSFAIFTWKRRAKGAKTVEGKARNDGKATRTYPHRISLAYSLYHHLKFVGLLLVARSLFFFHQLLHFQLDRVLQIINLWSVGLRYCRLRRRLDRIVIWFVPFRYWPCRLWRRGATCCLLPVNKKPSVSDLFPTPMSSKNL